MTHGDMPARLDDARTAALELLDRRSDQATVCPSEVARAIASKAGADPTGQAWRAVMPVVHAAIDQMIGRWADRPELEGKKHAITQRPLPDRSSAPRGLNCLHRIRPAARRASWIIFRRRPSRIISGAQVRTATVRNGLSLVPAHEMRRLDFSYRSRRSARPLGFQQTP